MYNFVSLNVVQSSDTLLKKWWREIYAAHQTKKPINRGIDYSKVGENKVILSLSKPNKYPKIKILVKNKTR